MASTPETQALAPQAPSPHPAVQAPQEAAVRRQREPLVTSSPVALLDTAQFEHMQRIATIMSRMELLPLHLRARPWFYPKKKTDNLAPAEESKWRQNLGEEGFRRAWEEANQRTVANCILVVDKALRWGLDPFAVMNESYEVGGKLADQGKLVAAVVNARAGLKQRLSYEFSGELGTDGRTVRVVGTFVGEEAPRTVELSVGQGKTQNDMWRKDPDQKLIYSGVVKWARRHCPEIVLGVMTEDDLERMQEAAPRAPVAGSALDAFAQASSALPAAPPPAIEVGGDPLPEAAGTGAPAGSTVEPAEEVAAASTLEAPSGDDLANPPEAAAAGGEGEAGGAAGGAGGGAGKPPAGRGLSPERVAKLRALVGQPPAVDEAAVAASLSPGARRLEDVVGEPGEAPGALYTRVLTAVQEIKHGGRR